MTDAVVMLAALAAVPILLRIGLGGGGGSRSTVRIRWRVPLRDRFPRLWWSGVVLGAVLLGVGWLASSCGWWSP
ncbi:hypothetical protein [Actinomadura violacea]|uniref:Uncharacterized protein n=1 Tax=Actinomadura violacea TaxID=2819934 RepID=A0ABS3RR58_9ACTN|nr:hypothetical protein [Actinomadura violacea]MBO2459240.1 hypothetical protein [Actinomadura violacea]